jgi:hypothetical protein
VQEPIPILTVASAPRATRSKWLERLFEAVQNDRVEYLLRSKIAGARSPDTRTLIDEFADRRVGRLWSAMVAGVVRPCLIQEDRNAFASGRSSRYAPNVTAANGPITDMAPAATTVADRCKSSAQPGRRAPRPAGPPPAEDTGRRLAAFMCAGCVPAV